MENNWEKNIPITKGDISNISNNIKDVVIQGIKNSGGIKVNNIEIKHNRLVMILLFSFIVFILLIVGIILSIFISIGSAKLSNFNNDILCQQEQNKQFCAEYLNN